MSGFALSRREGVIAGVRVSMISQSISVLVPVSRRPRSLLGKKRGMLL